MNNLDRQITLNSNKRSRLIFLLLFFSLFSVSSYGVAGVVPSAAFEKHFNKNTIVFQKKGLSIYRSPYTSKKEFCNADPKTIYHQLDAFYDSPHLQRLKRMGSSYNVFIKDTVIPAIVKTCGSRVNAKNMNVVISMHKIDQVNTQQDTMYFISREKGITYTNYVPHDAKKNLTQGQIEALAPAYIKELSDKKYKETIADIERSDYIKKYDWSCRYGCVTLCNDSSETYTIATSHMRWRAEEGGRRQVETEGWFKLKPNHCYPPQMRLYWRTYYSIAIISKNGKWTFPRWPVANDLMSGQKSTGFSGIREHSVCVKKTDKFLRHVPGKYNAAFNKSCPAGYINVPVNLFSQGTAGTDAVHSLGEGATSSRNRVRVILLPESP